MKNQLACKHYRDLKSYLKDRYGEPVHRIPIDANFSCPHKDSLTGRGGCVYCDPTGSGFSVDRTLTVKEQVEKRSIELVRRGISKFIAYFQAHSNTFAPVERLRRIYRDALIEGVVALDVSTRPDLVPENTLKLLDSFADEVDVILELGLQSVNHRTLKAINRGHTLAEFVDAVVRARRCRLEIVAHVITNLPWDDMEDIVECAKILSAVKIDGVKLHSLYVVEDSPLGQCWNKELYDSLTLEDFLERTVTFLEYVSPEIVIHRLVSDPPRNGVVFGNWGLTKIEILNLIDRKMVSENRFQGAKFSNINA